MNYFRPIQNKVKHAAQVEVIDIEARAMMQANNDLYNNYVFISA